MVGVDYRVTLTGVYNLCIRQFSTGYNVYSPLRNYLLMENGIVKITGKVVYLMLPQVG